MVAVEQLITENLDIWSSAIKKRGSQGRGSSKKLELYGIKKLRELILELAVRGLLVPQDPNDEKAITLLEKIKFNKEELSKDKKFKYPPSLPDITEQTNELRYPQSWIKGYLGDVCNILDKLRKPISKNNRIEGPYPYYGASGVVDFVADFIFDEPLVLVGEDGAKWGAGDHTAFSVDGKTWVNNHAHVVKPNRDIILDEFLVYVLAQQDLQKYITGITVPKLNQARLFSIVLPIPSIAEQHRIVAKVDELMALCDQLEQQQESSISAHQTLVETLLAALTNAGEKGEFNQAWARIAEHFDTLFTTEHSIDQLKQTILQLAVIGKLVPQDPNDEPASKLLEKIVAEKERLIEDKKIKPHKKLPDICEEKKPFDIPKSWKWSFIGDVLWLKNGYAFKSKYFNDSPTKYILATPGSFHEVGGFRDRGAKTKYYDGPINKEFIFCPNDLMIAMTEQAAGLLGSAAFIPDDTKVYLHNQRLGKLTAYDTCLDSRYIYWFFNAAYLRNELAESCTGMKVRHTSPDRVLKVLFTLPPYNEQLRIVSKIEELLTICDKLKAQISTVQTTQLHLADAITSIPCDENKEDDAMKENPSALNQKKTKIEVRPPSSIKKFVLRSFEISTKYRSLPNTIFEFHEDNELPADAEPICLVGLNGSGKSNLIEAIADIFCYLEMINLPWKSLSSASSKYRKSNHHFELKYTVVDSEGSKDVVIRKAKKAGAEFLIVGQDNKEMPVELSEDRLALLPRRIVGYSSGLNETVSHPFLRTRTLYSEEVREAAPPLRADLSLSKVVFDTNTLYMDYENNAEILLCNFIFRSADDLDFINKYTRVEGVSSFKIKFNRKIAGKSSDKIARITDELESYVKSFAACAGQDYESDKNEHSFEFELTDKVKKKFIKEFKTAENLFLAMYKWSLLNALVLSAEQRKVFLKEDVTKGTLERPPVVAPKDRLFDVSDVKVKLSNPKIAIDYSGLSDGEHQFIQVFGTVLLFSEPGTLFLLDEPESHFNPEWRTKFNSVLNEIPNASTHEFIISTHSPYLVSGSKGENVYKFTRKGGQIDCQRIDGETYGASFDSLLKKLFSIDSLIDVGARNEMEAILKRGDLEEMEEAVEGFAESKEKRKLYQAIIEKQKREA